MAEPSWEDLFGDPNETPAAATPSLTNPRIPGQSVAYAPEAHSRRELREAEGRVREEPTRRSRSGGGKPPKKRRRFVGLWIVLGFVVVIAGVGVWGYATFGPEVRHLLGQDAPIDYTGAGNGQPAEVTIVSGQVGNDISKSLYKAGVTKTPQALYVYLLKQSTQPTFDPGTYKLEKHMSAKSALADLVDPKNRVVSNVVIPEGKTLPQVLALLSTKTGVPLADFQSAARNYNALGVPSKAPSLEGFLFPATYQFDPGLTAKQILQRMVDRMNVSLKSHGVSKADELKVLTLASIIQKEGGSAADFPKVSRVFTNRLRQGIHLQSDATVSYGAHSTTISTTAAQRADPKNKYNTYYYAGLPVGPISAPGDAAITAALHPVAGSWLYFVLVNGNTGKTVFSDTLAEHNVAVLQWQAWLRAHPGYGQ